jgi:hypothetical protein
MAIGTLLATGASLLEPWPMQIVVDHVLGSLPATGVLARGTPLLPGADTRQGLLFWAALAGLMLFAMRSCLNIRTHAGHDSRW